MARTARIKRTGTGTAHYHLMSRTNDRRFLFRKGAVKTELVAVLKRVAAFCGVGLEAYAAMDNHFHVVCEVTRSGEPVPEEEVVRRYAALKGEKAASELAERWRDLRRAGMESVREASVNALRRRMGDVSEFMKLFKEEFDRAFKRGQAYCGSIWSGRFKSTLVEGGRYLEACKRYALLNPVRAGIVGRAKDYAWSWMREPRETGLSAGAVPAEELLRRVAQIGEGKVFGSEAFVREAAYGFGSCFRASHVGPHPAGRLGYSTHGWLVARREVA